MFDWQVSSPSTCLLTCIQAHWQESLEAPCLESSQKFELGKPWPIYRNFHSSTTPKNINPKPVTPSYFLKPFSDLLGSLLCSILPPPPPQEVSCVSNEHFYTFWQICGVISLGIWTKFWMGGEGPFHTLSLTTTKTIPHVVKHVRQLHTHISAGRVTQYELCGKTYGSFS